MAVVGVAHDDVLNLGSRPSPEHEIVAETPLEDDLVARCEIRNIDQAPRVTVDHEGIEGWVNFRCVALWGLADGRTSDIVQMSDAHVGDLGEVTVDVVGLGDDAMVGYPSVPSASRSGRQSKRQLLSGFRPFVQGGELGSYVVCLALGGWGALEHDEKENHRGDQEDGSDRE